MIIIKLKIEQKRYCFSGGDIMGIKKKCHAFKYEYVIANILKFHLGRNFLIKLKFK